VTPTSAPSHSAPAPPPSASLAETLAVVSPSAPDGGSVARLCAAKASRMRLAAAAASPIVSGRIRAAATSPSPVTRGGGPAASISASVERKWVKKASDIGGSMLADAPAHSRN